jgi:putative salt-induced outer membrane protein YdiY
MPLRLKVIAMILISISLSMAHASILVMPNGDRLTGHVADTKQGLLYFYADVLKSIVTLDASSAKVVETESPIKKKAVVTPPASASTAKPNTPKPKNPWKGKLELGYSEQTALGIHAVNLSVRAEESKTVKEDEYLAKSRILYTDSAQIATAEQADASFRWRHTLSPLLFSQSETSFNKDKIQLIDYRFEQNVGLGFKVLEDPRKAVNVVFGLTGENLRATGVEGGFSYLGKASEDFSYKINSRIKFTQDASIEYSPLMQNHNGLIPSLTQQVSTSIAEYNYKILTNLENKITNTLSYNLRFEYEYNNATLDPAARTEQKFISALSYGF